MVLEFIIIVFHKVTITKNILTYNWRYCLLVLETLKLWNFVFLIQESYFYKKNFLQIGINKPTFLLGSDKLERERLGGLLAKSGYLARFTRILNFSTITTS
jgi:hypothetical protein